MNTLEHTLAAEYVLACQGQVHVLQLAQYLDVSVLAAQLILNDLRTPDSKGSSFIQRLFLRDWLETIFTLPSAHQLLRAS